MWQMRVQTTYPDTSLNPGTGTLSPLGTSPFAAGAGGVNSVTVDPSGQFVFLAGYGGLFVYSINQNQGSVTSGFPFTSAYGQLTPVSGSPFGGGNPSFVAVDYKRHVSLHRQQVV